MIGSILIPPKSSSLKNFLCKKFLREPGQIYGLNSRIFIFYFELAELFRQVLVHELIPEQGSQHLFVLQV